MALSTKNLTAAIRAPFWRRFGLGSAIPGGIDYAYDNNFTLKFRNFADDADITALRVDTGDEVGVGPGYKGVKIFARPTTGFATTFTGAFGLQVKSEFTGTATGHACVEVTADWKGNGAAGGGVRAVQGVARVASTFTMGAGSLIGNYGQIKVDGTVNGAAAMLAAQYGLIEDGGTYTACSHVAAGWFDSHLTKTVTAGTASLLYLTNNGTTTLDSVFFVYAGNKITNLFNIDSVDTGLVSDITAGAATITNWRTIKCNIHGETKYLVVGDVA